MLSRKIPIGFRGLLAAAFLFVFFPFASKADKNFADMTCAEVLRDNREHNADDFLKTFGVEQIERFERKYPNYDLSEFEAKVRYHEPKPSTHDDANPFLWVIFLACDGSGNPEETLGARIEKILYTLPSVKKYRPESYYPGQQGYNP